MNANTSVAGGNAWRDLPAAQQPEYPDAEALRDVLADLTSYPPLVFAGECDQLRARMGAVAKGEAFLLQGGDCAEAFDAVSADHIRAKLKTLLQMSAVLTYAASVPVVKVGRIMRPVLQAALQVDRDPRRRHPADLPRRLRQRLRLHRGSPDPGP